MPNRVETPKTNEERADNQLSKRIAQHKNDFPKDVWENMQELKEKGRAELKRGRAELKRNKAADLLEEVRRLGRCPIEY